MTPVKPMLAEACRSLADAIKKSPFGLYSEIKYDGALSSSSFQKPHLTAGRRARAGAQKRQPVPLLQPEPQARHAQQGTTQVVLSVLTTDAEVQIEFFEKVIGQACPHGATMILDCEVLLVVCDGCAAK